MDKEIVEKFEEKYDIWIDISKVDKTSEILIRMDYTMNKMKEKIEDLEFRLMQQEDK